MVQHLEALQYSEYEQDIHFMRKALKLARKGKYTTSPNPAVGCVIVKDNEIIGCGYHHQAGQPHAEVMALRSAKQSVEGATCYVTLEPCAHYGRTPPCAKALCEAKVKRVVIATTDPNPLVAGKGIAILEDAGIKVEVGVCQEQALHLNRAFFKSISQRLPYTVVKFGMSIDAKLALSNGESKWITNKECRSDVQRLRLWADAMITSHVTVKLDNCRLNVRYEELPKKFKQRFAPDEIKQPLKVVLDSHGSLLENDTYEQYDIFKTGKCYLVVGSHEPLTKEVEVTLDNGGRVVKSVAADFLVKEIDEHVSLVTVPMSCHSVFKAGAFVKEEHIDLISVLKFLDSLQVRIAMVEAGAHLGSAFFTQGLVDECYLYVGTMILGTGAQDAFTMQEPKHLCDAFAFSSCKIKALGDNVCYHLLKK